MVNDSNKTIDTSLHQAEKLGEVKGKHGSVEILLCPGFNRTYGSNGTHHEKKLFVRGDSSLPSLNPEDYEVPVKVDYCLDCRLVEALTQYEPAIPPDGMF